ncbi:GILT-like protein 1 isoform X1 [Penaeus chinensis]|uniref:GILT-like protein 1 isoform X1 n=1 Tax=Penaeus chinensis TaxID=139456 RepID=UPI001FB61F6B|nr:GILT-like protein 1 isoform X1 [Penaeus chinensis]
MFARTALAAALLAVALAAVRNGFKNDDAAPITIAVYLESQCPDSARFVTEQLHPAWLHLRDILALDINFYGKAQDEPSPGGYAFTCQHGPEECKGNMMLTCAKKYIPSEDRYMAFVNCVMRERAGVWAGYMCAQEAGITYQGIATCSNSFEGQRLLHEVGEKQRRLSVLVSYVPLIFIDGLFSVDLLDAAEANLGKLVCETYRGPKPNSCSFYEFFVQL